MKRGVLKGSRDVISSILAMTMLIGALLAVNASYFSIEASETVNGVNVQLGFFSESQLLENQSDWFNNRASGRPNSWTPWT